MRENQDDHISKKIKEQEAKERKFNKLDEWEKRAVIDDKKRKMELNKQWNKDHQSPYTIRKRCCYYSRGNWWS